MKYYHYSLYGFYKHAMYGPPDQTTKPSIFHRTERLKWDIWNKIATSHSRDEAWFEYLSLCFDLQS